MEFPTTCILCGKAFEGKRADAKYCSSTCRSRASRENSGDGSSTEITLSPATDVTDLQTRMFAPLRDNALEADDECTQLLSSETRRRSSDDHIGRMEQLEFLATSHERLQSRIAGIESSQGELEDLAGRLLRLEAECAKNEARARTTSPDASAGLSRLSAKIEALETRLTPLAGVPEKLRAIERRAGEASELATRLEALDVRSQVVPRLQRSLTELQSRLESGLEEARARKSGDGAGTTRLLEARIAPLEQRLERLAAQTRTAVPIDESRLLRIEQRLERLQTKVNASPDEDSSGRLFKLERKLIALQARLEDSDGGPGRPSVLLGTLEGRIDALETSLGTLHDECVKLAHWVRESIGGGDDEDDSGSSWDDEDD